MSNIIDFNDYSDAPSLDLSGYDVSQSGATSYWLVLKDGKPRDLVRSTATMNTSVVETERLLKHKRFVESDYFPMDHELYEYVAISQQELMELSSPKKIWKFKANDRFSERGNRHDSEKREVVLESYEAGRTVANISKDFKVSRATVYRWIQEADYESCLTP